jgi:predicted SnoaL-like aldol condensation-catalyzing enzyme
VKYEHHVIAASGDFVIVHGRFAGPGLPKAIISANIIRIEDDMFAEHWEVLQDEVSRAESKSGLPMFGSEFPS